MDSLRHSCLSVPKDDASTPSNHDDRDGQSHTAEPVRIVIDAHCISPQDGNVLAPVLPFNRATRAAAGHAKRQLVSSRKLTPANNRPKRGSE